MAKDYANRNLTLATVDGEGNRWMWSGHEDGFLLKIVGKSSSQTLILADPPGTMPFLVSDKPGSMYLMTAMGLRHLTAGADGKFRVGKPFYLEGYGGVDPFMGDVRRVLVGDGPAFDGKGHMVFGTTQTRLVKGKPNAHSIQRRTYQLHIIDLRGMAAPASEPSRR